MSFLSTGPFNHNRFAQLEEQRIREKMYFMEKKKAKKDYDGDGEVESSSKEHAGVVHNAIQKKKGGTPDGKDTRGEVKESSCSPGCDCDDCKGKAKKMKKEDVTRQDVIDYLIESGFTNNPVSSEVLIDNMSDAWLEQIIEDLAQRTKNIIDADRSGAHGPGHQMQKMMGSAAHAVNKAKHSARYMKGRVWHSEPYTL